MCENGWTIDEEWKHLKAYWRFHTYVRNYAHLYIIFSSNFIYSRMRATERLSSIYLHPFYLSEYGTIHFIIYILVVF